MTHRVLVLAIVLASAPLHAQQPAVKLTLDDAIAQAIANSQRLAELAAREDAARAAVEGRHAAGMPVVAMQAGYTRTNHVEEFAVAQPGQPARLLYPDLPDNYRTRLDLQWPIFTGGRTAALERAAAAERSAAAMDVAAARADLTLEVTRAFWALVTARDAERVVTGSLEGIQAHVRDLRSRLEQGLIPPNEVLSAEAQASRRRVQVIEASNTRRVAEADLRRLTGRGAAEPVEPGATLDTPRAGLPATAAQRPERIALEHRAAAAAARTDAAAASKLPQVALAGGYDYARPNPRIFPRSGEWQTSWDLSVNVGWTLWDGGRRRAEQGEAAALAAASATRIADFDRQSRFEVEQRTLELESSAAAIEAAADGVRAAVEARRVVNERFTAGVATSTDVLDADIAVLQAELDRTRALANARLAEARLARALGAPLDR